MPARILRTALALDLLLTVPFSATGPSLAAQKEPVRVTTRLVQLNVVVKDRSGNPVADLTPDDFEVLEDGQRQTISAFAVNRSQPVTTAVSTPAQPVDAFVNRVSGGGVPQNVTVILLDSINTRAEDQAIVREQVTRFLQKLDPGDRVALYHLGKSLTLLRNLTSDPATLLQAVSEFRGELPSELMGNGITDQQSTDPYNDSFTQDVNRAMTDYHAVSRALRTIQSLEAIANHLGAIPGRKSLVWPTSSFPIQVGMDRVAEPDARELNNLVVIRRAFLDEMNRALRALNRANVAIYPIDARGLVGAETMDPAFNPTTPAQSRARTIQPGRPGTSREFATSLDSIQRLADRTGGRAFFNNSDIAGSMRRAVEDSRLSYVLGYYPTNGNWDGKFRTVRVRAKRRGLSVHTRSGYFAYADQPLTDEQGRALMRVAAWSDLDATGIGLAVNATRFSAVGSDFLKVEATISPRDLSILQEAGAHSGVVEYVLLQRRANGEVFSSSVFRQEFKVVESDFREVIQEGFRLVSHLELQSGAETVMLVVRDPASGAMGSVRIPLSRIQPEAARLSP